jgi:hypothetical protein
MSDRRLGLDELMIVNPGPGSFAVLLGADGCLHRVNGRGQTNDGFFLGEDGDLYKVGDPEPAALGGNELFSPFFLGDDGMLYELIPD